MIKSLQIAILTVLAILVLPLCRSIASVPVRVGIYQNEPKVYMDKQGRPAGFFPEILRFIAEKEDWDLEYIPCTWSECLNKVENRDLDLMMDVAFTESRAERFTFNREVVLGNWSRVYARARDGIQIRSILDLDGKKIAVVRGSIQANKLKVETQAFGFLPLFIEVENFSRVFDLVEKGEADCGVVNRLFGAQQMENFGLQETNVVLFPSKLMFIAPKAKSDKLLDRIDSHLMELKKDRRSIYYAALERALAPVNRPIYRGITLTAEESSWLAKHPEIWIAINQDWPPMDYVNEQKRPQGVGVGFIRALNVRLDGRLKIVPLPWEEMYDAVKGKQIDAMMDITPRPDREHFFNFTRPYVSIPHTIIAPKDAPYYSKISDLKGKTVGVERGFFLEGVLLDKYPGIRVKLFNTTSDALDAVSKGAIDAYIGNRAVAMYIIERELIINLKVHGKIGETASINAIGVRKDLPVLRDILQKGLDSLSRDEVGFILRRWVAPRGEDAVERIHLSPEEKDWIVAYPVLHLGYDTDWPPVEYVDSKGRFVGMSADFMRLLSGMLGITIKPTNPQGRQTKLDGIKAGSIDILCSVSRTPRSEEVLFFSKPYLRFPMVIVTGLVVPYIGDINELAGKKVAVVNGYASHDILKVRHSELDLLPVDDVAAGLHAVFRGDAYAFVGSLAAVSQMISREGMKGLKVSGETPYDYRLCVGVRKDMPILAGIIQKAVNAVTEEERNAISKRWISVTYEHRIDYRLLWNVLIVSILIVLVILYWNHRLAREIGIRRKVEGELIEAKGAAESANKVKSAFLANMSHELRTPLNSIIGFTGIILNELAGPLNLEQKKQLKMVKGSAGHLLNLINDVLDISKIEAGELDMSCEKFSMPNLITQVAESLMPLAVQKGLSLSGDIAPEVDKIVSDERRIRQVLINLVNNAIKFTERGGVKIICSKRESTIVVEVRDSGIGIKEEDIGKLFKPFQQLDTGISRRYEGTGLGLSVCKRIIEMLGGEIQVMSQFGKGSTFYFTLPLNREEKRDEKEDPDH